MKKFPATGDEAFEVEIAPPVDLDSPAEQQLEVRVLFTGETETEAALASAADLACWLKAQLTLVVLQVVPRPLPPECPPVSVQFLEQRVHRLVAHAARKVPVNIYLCRDKHEALAGAFSGSDLVIIGVRQGWWRGKNARLGKDLEHLGHRVLYVEK